jgi:hypothetical protein
MLAVGVAGGIASSLEVADALGLGSLVTILFTSSLQLVSLALE